MGLGMRCLGNSTTSFIKQGLDFAEKHDVDIPIYFGIPLKNTQTGIRKCDEFGYDQ